MGRAQNFYYQNPMESIGSSLATAIFGNPEMAQKAAMQRSQMAENDARARLAGAQAQGHEDQHTAGESLPALLAAMNAPNAPLPSLDDPNFVIDAAPSGPPPAPDANFRNSLPAVVAALSRMQGDKVDTGETIGTLASFLGGDELARRGLVAQGHTPGEEFALTPERADAIARQGYDADQAKSFGVARINHESDIPVANIRARSAFNVAQVNHANDIPVAEIGARGKPNGMSRGERNNNPGNLEYGPFAKRLGATGTDGRFAIFPTFEAGMKAQEALLGGSGYLGGGRNTIDAILLKYAPPSDGNSVDNYGNYVSRVTGIGRNQPITQAQIPLIAEAMRQFETGGTGKAPGKASTKAAAAPKPPKAISAASMKLIDTEFDKRYPAGSIKETTRGILRSQVVQEFQRSGDPVGAVIAVINRNASEMRARRGQGQASAPQPGRSIRDLPLAPPEYAAEMGKGPPVPGARKAPDGQWYVQTGKKPDGSPSYSRVG